VVDVTDDPRYRLVYEEARRAIGRQEQSLDEFRSRVGSTLAATVIATAFFGTIAIGQGPVHGWEWWAISLFIATLLIQIFLLVPLGGWRFRFAATAMIRDYVEDDPPATIDQMYRDLALHLDSDFRGNAGRLTWMWWTFTGACSLLGVELLLWLLALRH
jgi:hypothetical protein